MYHQGHYVKMKKPTGPELYEDASRILDELLQKQLNDQLKSQGRPPRFKTHPLSSRRPVTSGEVLDERDEAGLEDGIERSKTMPSRMRGASKDEALLPKDLEALRKKGDKHNRLKGDSSASSADTEGDSASVIENRKKKGLLRRAKDRFIHSFHRQERAKENRSKDTDSPKVSPKKQAKKAPWKKAGADQNGVKDKGSKCDGVRDGKEAPQFSQAEGYGKRRNSAGKLLNSLRKSFRSKKEDRRARSSSIHDDDRHLSAASSSGTSRRSQDQGTPPPPPPSSTSPHPRILPSPPHHHHPAHPSGDALMPPPPPGSSLTVPATSRKDSSHSAHEKSVSPYPHSSSTDSHLGSGGVSSSVHSFSSKNVLDDPGDDIEFMDQGEGGDDLVQNGYGEAVVGYAGRDGVRIEEEEVAGGRGRHVFKQQSSLCVDGDTDTQDGKGRPPKNTEDIPVHERTAEEKEEMYGKIAQKLIHIADTFAADSGMSDAEAHHHREGAAAAARLGPEGDGMLNELERQILECLRDAGDRNAPIIENQAEEVIQQTKAQTYERFKTTVQQSLGSEVSWNHLAFLFYTTKGVISAVGLGSKVASDAKEMTLRYFSDKFAKWLMDQGGFDSVLSESDSDLD